MNLVPIEAWSFSKVNMKSLGFATTSSYFARGGGYEWDIGAASFMGNNLLLTQLDLEDAINITTTPWWFQLSVLSCHINNLDFQKQTNYRKHGVQWKLKSRKEEKHQIHTRQQAENKHMCWREWITCKLWHASSYKNEKETYKSPPRRRVCVCVCVFQTKQNIKITPCRSRFIQDWNNPHLIKQFTVKSARLDKSG